MGAKPGEPAGKELGGYLVAGSASSQRQGHSARAPAARPSDAFYGALDLGTNNCRLLVARRAGEGFTVVDSFSRIVRLGEGLARNRRLSDAAMARSLGALRVCAGKLRRRGVSQVRAVATDACRRAENCDSFLAVVQRETGIKLEIISGREEAHLAIYGCAPLFDPKIPNALVFDIGGGSTEVSWLKVPGQPVSGDRNSGLIDWCSLPLGVVNLAERFGGRSIPVGAYAQMVQEVSDAIRPFEAEHQLGHLARNGGLQMLGTSGTVTTLVGIHKKLPRYDRARVDGAYLDMETIIKMTADIAQMGYADRVAQACIGPERADLVVAGCAILEGLCRTWPVQGLRVADRGLREGILCKMMNGGGRPCAGGAPA